MRMLGDSQSVMEVLEATYSDAGDYQCVASTVRQPPQTYYSEITSVSVIGKF